MGVALFVSARLGFRPFVREFMEVMGKWTILIACQLHYTEHDSEQFYFEIVTWLQSLKLMVL